MNEPRLPDYTERKDYTKSYAQTHREQINANKRKWRAARKKLATLSVDDKRVN